ncbi:putative Ig domain-containing protein, partial [Clostridium perfringens]
MNVAPALTISGSPGEGATVGGQYVAQFTAAGGAGTNTFALASGSLPAWLSLDATSGRLVGTPGSGDIGIFGPFVVSVSDAN